MSDKVIWSEGMVLSPQHLQQAELLSESQLRFHALSLNSFHYGLTTLDLDTQALENGFFSVRQCSGVFPDGTGFDSPSQDPGLQQRAFEEMFPADKERLGVHVAVPALAPGEKNLAAQTGGRPARFVGQGRTVGDLYADNQSRDVVFGRMNLRLLFDGESLEGYQSLKIAELSRDARGQAIPDPEFIPACLRLGAADALSSRLKKLLDTCSQKHGYLLGQRAQKASGAALFNAETLTQYLMISAIGRHTPPLIHFHQQAQIHPEKLFSHLISFAGDLLTFGSESRPTELPRYVHGDLRQSFLPVFKLLEELLGLAVPTGYRIFPLIKTSPIQYVANMKDADVAALAQVYLAVSAQASEVDIITTVQRKAKVGPVSKLESIVSSAMPGIGLVPESQPPQAVPAKAGYKYFRVQQSGELWDLVKQSKALAVHMPSDLPTLKLELVTV